MVWHCDERLATAPPLGRVGKTQLALRHLDVHRGDYWDGRFWLRADRPATLVGDLASLAWRLESGTHVPSLTTVSRLARQLGSAW